jgi:uncharacterized protein (DUF488 family)
MRNQSQTLTIGHSTLTIDAFLKALRDNDVETLVDVRAFPGSRRYPQFGRDALTQSLTAAGVAYQLMPALGGRRKVKAESENRGWRNESFRGYADYMQTPEFAAGLNELVELSQRTRLAYMCSEAVPWRCHRSLISDALTARGIAVEHIFVKANGESERRPHSMTPFAQVMRTPSGPQITYPAEQAGIPFSSKAS